MLNNASSINAVSAVSPTSLAALHSPEYKEFSIVTRNEFRARHELYMAAKRASYYVEANTVVITKLAENLWKVEGVVKPIIPNYNNRSNDINHHLRQIPTNPSIHFVHLAQVGLRYLDTVTNGSAIRQKIAQTIRVIKQDDGISEAKWANRVARKEYIENGMWPEL